MNPLLRPLRSATPAVTTALTACLSLGTVGSAAANEKTETELREDIAFARGLAADWQFIDLAETVLDDLSAANIDRALRPELQLAYCEVYAAGARYTGDPELRKKLFQDALESYTAFIDNYGSDNKVADVVSDAKRSYVDLTAAYVSSIELELEDAVGEEADALRSEVEDRVMAFFGMAGEEINSLQLGEPSERERQELAKMMLYRAQMGLIAGRIADPTYLTSAEGWAEDVTAEFGDTSGWGLSAYLVLGQVYLAQGAPVDAADIFYFVVDTTITFDKTAWDAWIDDSNPPQARLDGLWYFLELGIPKLIEAQLAAGDSDGALASALHLHNNWVEYGFDLTPRGHLALLEVARTMLDIGGFLGGQREALQWYETYEAASDEHRAIRIRSAADLALELAGVVNDDNKGNTLQIRAQQLIADAIGRPGVEVGLDVLFEAAKGYYNGGDWEQAIASMRQVLAAAKDEAERRLHYPKVYWHIGRSYQRMERQLEAAMAFREGVDRWSGDAEYDGQNANGFYSAMQRVRRTIKDDDEIERLFREAESFKASIGDSTDIVYTQARRDFDAGDYANARERFREVAPEATNFEKAIVKAARCLYAEGDPDAALAEFDAYLNDFVNDPKNRIGATEAARQAARNEATAEAVYFKGQIANDAQDYRGVIDQYGDFADRFGGQADLAAATLYYCVQAGIELGDLDTAKRFEQRLLDEYPSAQWTGNGATRLFNYVAEMRDRATQAGDEVEAQRMLREMATYAEISNSLSANPSFTSLLQEARFWRDLGDWAKAEEDYARITREFSESNPTDVAKRVTPDLALAILEQGRLAEALDLVTPLVPDPDADDAKGTSLATVKTYCRAVAGWLEGDPTSPTIVPGVGQADDYDRAGRWWRKISNTHTKWLDCAWYESELSRAWTYYQFGTLDSGKTAVAEQIIKVIRTETGSSFNLVQENCDDDPRVRDLFRWLNSQL